MKKWQWLILLALCFAPNLRAQTVIFRDTFSTTSGANNIPNTITDSATQAAGTTGTFWYTLTARAVDFGVSCSGADYPTCAQITVNAGDSGDNLLTSCTVNGTNCSGTGVAFPNDYYVYVKMQISNSAFDPGTLGKLIYNKTGSGGQVCYYIFNTVSTNPWVVGWHPYCDVPDDTPGYYSPNFTVGTAWHTLEEHYVNGTLFDTRIDGSLIVSFPSGTGGGTMPNVPLTDVEPGLYSNAAVNTGSNILLNDLQICTGTWCSGSGGSGALLAQIPFNATQGGVQKMAYSYAAGSGTANAQTLTLAPAPAAYATGLAVAWLPSSANTGAATLNVNSLGATTITKVGGAALVANDLTTTAIALAVYDGTNFELQNPQTAPVSSPVTSVFTRGGAVTAQSGDYSCSQVTGCATQAGVQNLSYSYAAGGGTANAQTLTLTPAPASYAAGLAVAWEPSNANTGAATLNVNSLGAKTILKVGGAALAANDLTNSAVSFAIYDGTNFELQNPQTAPASAGVTSIFTQTGAVGNLTGDVTTSGSTATTIAANAVNSSKMAVVNTRRTCDIAIGDTSGSAIASAQLGPQKRMCYIPAAATIVEMDVAADGGTPSVILAVNHAGTDSNIVSAALATAGSGGIACSNTGGTTGLDGATTCSSTLQNTSMAAGDYLELVSGTAGGTAKLMTVHIVYTVN